jgi:GT2 family glycosyltransferase
VAGQSLAAVTLNWRDLGSTVHCVDSLLAQDISVHVYVVDNESDGRLAADFSERYGPQVTVIEVPENRGFAAGMNLGLRAALDDGASAILAINNDATASPGALQLMEQCLLDPSVGIVGPQIVNPDGSLQSQGCTLKAWGAKSGEAPRNDRVDFFTWACVLLRADMLESIGLLDESFFMYWEDADFGVRLKKAGWNLSFCSPARITHALSASHGRAGVRIGFYSTLGLQRMARIHGGAWRIWVPYRVLGRVVVALAQLNVAYAKAVLAGARFGRADVAVAYTKLNSTDSL